jgi:hypothetical protein
MLPPITRPIKLQAQFAGTSSYLTPFKAKVNR